MNFVENTRSTFQSSSLPFLNRSLELGVERKPIEFLIGGESVLLVVDVFGGSVSRVLAGIVTADVLGCVAEVCLVLVVVVQEAVVVVHVSERRPGDSEGGRRS